MAADRDDDALTWDGDDDPTLDVGASTPASRTPQEPAKPSAEDAPEAVALPEGFEAVGKGSADVGRINADGTVTMPDEPEPMGSAALVGFGVLGGVYLLYVIGWIVGGLRLEGHAHYLVSDVMFQGSFWLAVLAPVIWFGSVLLFTRRTRPWIRFTWLIAGAVLLVPWPFIMTGAVG